jgi:hypothetical protein
MIRKQNLTGFLMSDIQKGIEKEFQTTINNCGIFNRGDEQFNRISSITSFSHTEIGYIVLPILLGKKIILFNDYYKETKFINSPTRFYEISFVVEREKSEYKAKLKGLDSAINYIERYSGENTVRVIETSKTPFNEETSKIIDNIDNIDDAGYVLLCF